MKYDHMPTWLQRILFGTLALIFVLMPLHAFISTWGGTAIGPIWLWKSWKEIVLAILAVVVVVWLSWNPKRWRVLADDKLFWLIILFVGLLGILNVSNLAQNGREAAMAGLAMDTRYLLMFGLGYVLFRFGKFTWPEVRKWVAGFLATTGLVLGVLGLIQVKLIPTDFLSQFGYDKHATIAPYVLIDENPDALRAFVTLRGPNDYGAFLLLPLALSLLFAKRNKWFLVVALASAIGIIASGARSAWLAAIITVAALVVVTYGGKVLKSTRALTIGAAGLVVAVLVGIAAVNIPSVRLAVFHSSPGDSSLTEGSTDKHWQSTTDGIQRVIDNPIGCGPGCAGPASYYSAEPKISENYYVQIAEEAGVIGLALWVSIAGMVAWRLWKLRQDWIVQTLLASFAGLSAIGFWLHVWNDDPVSLIWWGIAGITLGYYASVSRKKPVS
jgi:O-antigen ligase